MSKFNPGNLLWFGTAPVPPEPKPYLLGWNPALSRFKPFTLPIKKLARSSSASTDFVASTRSMMEKVPPGIQAPLIKYGVAVLPALNIWDVSLWLSYGGPRGHGDRFKWPGISGLCMFDGHLLLICEAHESEKQYIRTTNLQGIFNHELGHCLDRALEHVSKSAEFLACVAEDVAKLTSLDKAIYRYLLQEGEAGPSEIFAECFACTQGLCCVNSWTKDMPVYFKSSFQFVQELVGRLVVQTPQETPNVL